MSISQYVQCTHDKCVNIWLNGYAFDGGQIGKGLGEDELDAVSWVLMMQERECVMIDPMT